MSRHFMFYWSPDTVRHEQERNEPIQWAASNQFGRLDRRGEDTLWIVTCFSGRLYLVGHLPVREVAEWEEAVEILGTDDIWEADYVAIADEDEARRTFQIDITDLAPRLRFKSERDRLRSPTGRVDPQQLQTMRELTLETSLLLRDRLKTQRN